MRASQQPPACRYLVCSRQTTFTRIPQGVSERYEASQNPWKIKTNLKRILDGRFPYLLTPNPWLGSQWRGSFPACKHDSLNWGLTGNRRGSAGGFAWTLLVSCSLIHSLNACVTEEGLGKEREEPWGGRGEGGGGGQGLGPHYLFARTKYKAFVLG